MNLPRRTPPLQRRLDREKALGTALRTGQWDAAARMMASRRTYPSPFALREAVIAEWIRRGRGTRV